MPCRILLAPVAALCLAGAVQAQTPVTPTPATPDSQTITRPVESSAAIIRGHLDSLLQGITLNAAQRTRVDSIVNEQTNIPVPSADSLVDAATRERLATMLGAVRTAVRAVLTVGQQMTFDSNFDVMKRRTPVSSS